MNLVSRYLEPMRNQEAGPTLILMMKGGDINARSKEGSQEGPREEKVIREIEA